MHYAKLASDFSYWKKQTKPLFDNLIWNIPEQKTLHVTLIGGNIQNFSTPVKISEYLNQNFPFSSVTTLLPDSLRAKLPPLPNLEFAPSTQSGSFDNSTKLIDSFQNSDGIILIGDLSKNSATAVAINSAIDQSLQDSPTKPQRVIITRDSVDLIAADASHWLNFPQITLIATMAQLQKVFRAIYYPKMILLSQPLIPTIETLHKFTLTYPIALLTFHENNIITAHAGNIITTPLDQTTYSPLMLWSGQLAANTLTLSLFNPRQNLEALNAAIFYQ